MTKNNEKCTQKKKKLVRMIACLLAVVVCIGFSNLPATAAGRNKIASVKVTSPYTVQVRLQNAQKLKTSDFRIASKYYKQGTYRNETGVAGITTKDRKTYILNLKLSRAELKNGEYVRVTVKNLTGQETSRKETCYKKDIYHKTEHQIYTGTKGQNTNWNIQIGHYTWYGEEYWDLSGTCRYTVKNLPDGLHYKVVSGSLYVYGTPKKTGKFTSTLKATDEFGNTQTSKAVFLIGSKTQIKAASEPYSELANSKGYINIEQPLIVVGGDGTYTYKIKTPVSGFSVNEYGFLVGKKIRPGSYKIKVSIKDKSGHTTDAVMKVTVKKGVVIRGKVVDKNGTKIKNSRIMIVFTNRDAGAAYTPMYNFWIADDGSFETVLEKGTYDVSVGKDDRYLTYVPKVFVAGKKISKDIRNWKFVWK